MPLQGEEGRAEARPYTGPAAEQAGCRAQMPQNAAARLDEARRYRQDAGLEARRYRQTFQR